MRMITLLLLISQISNGQCKVNEEVVKLYYPSASEINIHLLIEDVDCVKSTPTPPGGTLHFPLMNGIADSLYIKDKITKSRFRSSIGSIGFEVSNNLSIQELQAIVLYCEKQVVALNIGELRKFIISFQYSSLKGDDWLNRPVPPPPPPVVIDFDMLRIEGDTSCTRPKEDEN